MATTSHVEQKSPLVADAVDQLAAKADDVAARLAMDLESIADEADNLSRRLAELRADLTRERVLLDELNRSRR